MHRREWIKLTAAATALPLQQTANASEQRTFVLVHGAFHGGWCWAPVAQILRGAGHRVFTPTFYRVGRACTPHESVDRTEHLCK